MVSHESLSVDLARRHIGSQRSLPHRRLGGGAAGPHFPYGTLLVNVCGSFILGCLIATLDGRLLLPSDLRFFLGVGFLGAFTTFSSFSVETLLLLHAGSIGLGLINFLANNLARAGRRNAGLLAGKPARLSYFSGG